METIVQELRRIYAFDEARWDEDNFEDFSEDEKAAWELAPEELRAWSRVLHGHDLDIARPVASSLLELLEQAGSYRT